MTQLMGILNITPDSFSGDGQLTVEAALQKFEQLMADGADIIDLGAESTRPGATALSADDEWARLGPVLRVIAKHPLRASVKLSVDSYHFSTIAGSLELGIDMANDVSGLRETAMLNVLAQSECDVCVMHALSVPSDPAITLPADADVVAEILAWKSRITAQAVAAGIDSARLIYDPGLGFGKTAEQSLHLARHTATLVESGGRWLVGHSRKRFLSLVDADRDTATLQISVELARAGVSILRVHDVAAHRALPCM